MRIAICVSGICRGNVQKNMSRIQKAFDGDFFFSTWKGLEESLENVGVKNYFVFEEPLIPYHPLADISDNIMPPVHKTWMLRKSLSTNKSLRERMSHFTKQIIGHSYLLNMVPNSYDMIIRVRYDTYISDKADFSQFIKSSYKEKKAIGFGVRTSRHKDLDTLKVLPHVWPKKDSPSPGISNDWGGYIMDPMIFHPRDIFDHNLMWKLHNEHKLMAAERGWYQILSQPYGDNHESVYGGAQIEKYLSSTKH